MQKVRAKLKCTTKTTSVSGNEFRFEPVTSDSEENALFFEWTPFGEVKIGIVNPYVDFVPGAEYYLDFTPV